MAGCAFAVSPVCRLLVAVMAALSCLGLIWPNAAGALEEDKVVSKFVGKNWVNGRSWDKLEYAGKLGFVCGIFDGVTLYCSMAENEKSVKRGMLNSVYKALSVPSSLTVGDVVVGMDEFYRDPPNVPLPAVCAYLFVVCRERGDTPAAIEKRISKWRRMFPD